MALDVINLYSQFTHVICSFYYKYKSTKPNHVFCAWQIYDRSIGQECTFLLVNTGKLHEASTFKYPVAYKYKHRCSAQETYISSSVMSYVRIRGN